MAGHDAHFVTTKVAIYSPDGDAILVNRMNRRDARAYGLPGGHIDAGETPDQALVRELHEELGLKLDSFTHRDFFNHTNGKIVLGYVATLEKNTPLNPSDPDKETGEWLFKDEFTACEIDPGYKKFALKNWPEPLTL